MRVEMGKLQIEITRLKNLVDKMKKKSREGLTNRVTATDNKISELEDV